MYVIMGCILFGFWNQSPESYQVKLVLSVLWSMHEDIARFVNGDPTALIPLPRRLKKEMLPVQFTVDSSHCIDFFFSFLGETEHKEV